MFRQAGTRTWWEAWLEDQYVVDFKYAYDKRRREEAPTCKKKSLSPAFPDIGLDGIGKVSKVHPIFTCMSQIKGCTAWNFLKTI